MAEWSYPVFAHGGDYNPDQWLHVPGILEEDIRLMKLAGCNMMSVGIFSWAALEPEEGRYTFDWLQHVLDALNENGISVILATPSGARPAWISQKYPEVLRVFEGRRNLHGMRHNHCFTSPRYREMVTRMNTKLAEAFGAHPAVKGWHISNEYGGECHCELCQAAFRTWLQKKYGTLEALNHAWWTGFWAKTYTDWSQLHSPEPYGEMTLHGLTLDWKRFVTDQTIDFLRCEAAPIRRITPKLPITINMMGTYDGLDYPRFADEIDVASYDSYPRWGTASNREIALNAAFCYDLTRGIKKKPWLLMESTPSQVNWQEICKLKKPGMHLFSSMQAVAHGADSVEYFQWRKSRGASEKFHGAVVGHDGTEHTRTFRDVAEVGADLKRMTPVLGTANPAQIAVLFDWNNRWAIANAQGPRKDKKYLETVMQHYAALTDQAVNIDVIDSEQALDGYKLVAAPMLYLLKPGVAERLEGFVAAGGTLVLTHFSGRTDENDLCFLGGFPGPLRRLAGVWVEEIDALAEGEENRAVMTEANCLGLTGEYVLDTMCEIIHPEGAQVEAVYGRDFYRGEPVVTKNKFGQGTVYYIAARAEERLLAGLYKKALADAGVRPLLTGLPAGVVVTERAGANGRFLFILNGSDAPQQISLPSGVNLITGEKVSGNTSLPDRAVVIMEVR